MKRVAYFSTGILLGVIVGTLLAWSFNTWYMAYRFASDDDTYFLMNLAIFGWWPGSAAAGAWLANRAYRKRLSR